MVAHMHVCCIWRGQAQVTELEAVVEEVHDQFQSLDQQMSRASQTATKVGDRLQVGVLKLANCCF